MLTLATRRLPWQQHAYKLSTGRTFPLPMEPNHAHGVWRTTLPQSRAVVMQSAIAATATGTAMGLSRHDRCRNRRRRGLWQQHHTGSQRQRHSCKMEARAAGMSATAIDPLTRVKCLEAVQGKQLFLAQLPPSPSLWRLQLAISQCYEAQTEEVEGHCAPEQLDFLRSYVAQRFAGHTGSNVRMCQIGFNYGHSAVALLDQAPAGTHLLSLDMVNHTYTPPLERVVQEIAMEGGQKHILLKGDSADMLPRFRTIDFDLVFIDGNHAYEAVKMDFLNSLLLASGRTELLLNHVFTDMIEGAGPTRAWIESFQDGSIELLGWHSCCSRHGIAVNRSLLR